MHVHWILSIYSTLLALFPVRYQDEFGEELLYAVRMSVEQAQARGRLFVIRLAWRELRDLPGACLQAHLSERRGMMMKLQPGAHLPDGPFKFWQLAAVFLPFSIAMLGVALDLSPGGNFTSLLCGIGVVFLGLLVVVWIAGLVKEFPIWTLPSLGLILFFFAYGLYLISQAVTLIALRPIWNSFWPNLEGFWPDSILIRLLMYTWFNLVYVAIAAVMMMALLAFSQRLLQLARKDWSLLSFFVYTLTIPYVITNRDEFRGLEPYQLISILILITGAVFFVILPARWTRLLVLLAATLLALTTVSLGLYQIFPAQEFAAPVLSFRVWEALQPVLDLPALLIILCLPWLVQRLPASYGYKRPATAA
jgi:hypothetical protein